ncbi:MAG: hypothetical protein OSJ58_16955 [Dysosmobacter sp.]|nr:hypothetical protein [Dysosmobacter sp.]
MERLTMRNSDGSVSQPTGTTVEAVFYRLAAYEDTGLEPEEITPLIPPPNDPLTLEELREMNGEPVWCEHQKNYVFIACVKDEPYKQIWFFTNKGKWDTILFHHTRFYRRKPEV